MDSFMGSFTNRNNSILDEQNDPLANISLAMNRSKLLLNEMVASTSVKPKSSGGLFKTSFSQPKSMLSQSMTHETIVDFDEPKEQKSSIYTQFKIDSNKNIDEDLNLQDLVESYAKICDEHLHILKDKIEHLNPNRNRDLYNRTLIEQDGLDKEKYIWSLIREFFQDEQETKNRESEFEADMDIENAEGLNETSIVRNLEKRNPFVRRVKLVINWLERIAHESDYMKKIKENLNSFTAKSVNWEHTLHNLKNSSCFGDKNAFSGREYVDELDPDAPIRLSKSLHDLDQEDEFKLMEYIFAFIRAGDLKSARDFCQKIGQSWRAATLEGFRLFNDKNYSLNSNLGMKNQKQIFKNEGNLNRDVWRLMVHKMIKDERFGPYEKAVYASLAGFVTPVLPVCRNFSDYIWIYFKALYNQIIEKEIRQRITNREFLSDPDDENVHIICGKSSDLCSNLTIKHIFDHIQVLIKNSSNIVSDNVKAGINTINASAQLISNLKSDANKPFSIILKHIILSGIDGFESGTQDLMEYLKNLLVSEHRDGLILRFSSHLALFYRTASYQITIDTFIQILDEYSKYLIDNNYKEIVAYYVSCLSSELQIKRYSKFLQTITDNKERMVMLKLAKERNMNVQAITQCIVDTLSKQPVSRREMTQRLDETGLSTTAFISQTIEMFSTRTNQMLTEEDHTKINAIDWIAYDPSQRKKLLEYANLTMRYFLLERQFFEATKIVFSKIPADTISIILSQYNLNQTAVTNKDLNFEQIIDNLPTNIKNLVKEYFCFKEYIESINLYNEWFEIFHKEKPCKFIPMDSVHHEKTFAEKISLDYEKKEFEENSSRWYSKALKYCEQVKAKFMSVLKFPIGGWMLDIKDMDDYLDEDESEEIGMEDDNMNLEFNLTVNQNTRNVETKRRKTQMEELRRFYLPNICFILLDMMTKMNLNKDLIRLSDLIASETYKLYSLFDNQQLRILLNKIADSSIVLLDSNKDYFGF